MIEIDPLKRQAAREAYKAVQGVRILARILRLPVSGNWDMALRARTGAATVKFSLKSWPKFAQGSSSLLKGS